MNVIGIKHPAIRPICGSTPFECLRNELLNLRRELDIGKDHCSREEFNLFSAPGKKCSFIIYIDIMDLFIMT